MDPFVGLCVVVSVYGHKQQKPILPTLSRGEVTARASDRPQEGWAVRPAQEGRSSQHLLPDTVCTRWGCWDWGPHSLRRRSAIFYVPPNPQFHSKCDLPSHHSSWWKTQVTASAQGHFGFSVHTVTATGQKKGRKPCSPRLPREGEPCLTFTLISGKTEHKKNKTLNRFQAKYKRPRVAS